MLRCWAVPKGPSLSTDDKRLAVETEDHPIEYADFEGIIPAGNYGAGPMIVWDRGQWISHDDPDEGIAKGKLLFDLKGYKLRGLWTLVRTKRNPKEWLLIKKPDFAATGEDAEAIGGESVLSGLTVEELEAGGDRAAALRADLERAGARRRRVRAGDVKPMLAEHRDRPFTRAGWLFELKYDGYRVIAGAEPPAAVLEAAAAGGAGRRTARRPRRPPLLPQRPRRHRHLPRPRPGAGGAALRVGGPRRRGGGARRRGAPQLRAPPAARPLTRRADVERAVVALPATYYVFDLLAFEGFDLRPLPLVRRKELLRRVLPRAGPLRFADHVEERGEALYAEVRRAGVEGVVAKRADAPYRGARSPAWLKIRAERSGDFAVVGFTRPQGSRAGFGALHLAALSGGEVGLRRPRRHRVQRPPARRDPRPARRRRPPRSAVRGRGAQGGRAHLGRSPAGRRGALHRADRGRPAPPPGLRPAARRQAGRGVPARRGRDGRRRRAKTSRRRPQRRRKPAAEARPTVQLSRLDKVFWPDEGYTKGDLIDYYREVAPRLLPFLAGRPLVLDRYPDGITGKSFYQKNAPDYLPDWIRTESIWSDEKETRYVVCDDLETLLYLANMGAIPLHLWASRVDTIQSPDWSILDLDAKEAPFSSVIAVAKSIHRLCKAIELPCFAKTSGATGLHVLVPLAGLAGRCTFEQSRQLAELIARVVVAELPTLVTLTRAVAAREGRVYLDYLQNGYGKLLVAPYSARPRPGATVSTPLAWREVDSHLDPKAYTIKTVPQRLAPAEERSPGRGSHHQAGPATGAGAAGRAGVGARSKPLTLRSATSTILERGRRALG